LKYIKNKWCILLVLIVRTTLVTVHLPFILLPNFSAASESGDTIFLVHTVATDTNMVHVEQR